MTDKNTVYATIKKSGNLPTLPEILLKLLDACDNDTAPLSDIAAIIGKDPALAAKVLQLVNSAYHGLSRTYTSIEQAVVYLGATSIKNIAVASAVHQVFERKRLRAVKLFNINDFWWHSLLCATLARRIAQKTGFKSLDEAYLSGLLHNIGRLVLIATYPREHESILLSTEDIRNQLWAEQQLIGITHCEAGAWLVKNWQLNSLMADAIRYHHSPLEKIQEAFPLVKIIYLANLLSEAEQDQRLVHEAGETLFGLAATDLVDILSGSTEEVLQVADSLNIQVRPVLPAPGSAPDSTTKESGVVQSPPASPEAEGRGQSELSNRLKCMTLLSAFLERLVQADSSETIIEIFEKAMLDLFSIDRVLFFLLDRDGVLLRARTSTGNTLHQLSMGLILPAKQSGSLIVKAFTDSTMTILSSDQSENLADAQILTAMQSSRILLLPITTEKRPAGLVLLALPEISPILTDNDQRLVQIMVQQVGLRFFIDTVNARKVEEMERERMAAVSMTARKFAHEINNPLAIISNYLTTMKLRLPAEHGMLNELAIIGEEINRISNLVSQMDIFSKKSSAHFESTDINGVIAETVTFVKSSLQASGTEIEFFPDESLPPTVTSRDTLKQILINLFKNAAEAMPDGGKVEVRTRWLVGDDDKPTEKHRDALEIVVDDNGPGIPAEIFKDLYKPFVSTKKSGHSGLGLSIAQKAVKDLGGTISCVNKPAGGTAFTLTLPVRK